MNFMDLTLIRIIFGTNKFIAMKTSYLKDHSGKDSLNRLVALIVVMAAIGLAYIIVLSAPEADSSISKATAGGTVFTIMTGTVMAFLFANKRKEVDAGLQDNDKVFKN